MKIFQKTASLEGALHGASAVQLWWSHLKKRWPLYVFGVFAIIATNVTEVLVPKLIQWIIDGVTQHSSQLGSLVGVLGALLVFQLVGRIVWRQTLGQQTHRVSGSLKSVIWNRARYLPKTRLESDLSPGELMNVATGDVNMARFIFGFTLVGTVDFIFLLGFTVTAMLFIDWRITFWSLIVIPALPFLLDRLSRQENLQHQKAQEALSDLTSLSAQAVSTVRLQRLTQSGGFWIRKLINSATFYKKCRFDVVSTTLAFIPITGVAPLISFAILIRLGVPKVLRGEISIGAFVAMQSYIFLIQSPLLELGTIISEWQRCFASLNRITELLAVPESSQLRSGGIPPTLGNVAFEVRDLTFAYPNGKRQILRKLNFRVKRGDRLGIKGSIGAGKSTLLYILSGFEPTFDGNVEFFGRDVRSYSHLGLRSLISVVPQKSFLFADTIRANILLNRDYRDDELWGFLEIAGLKDDVANFPDKLDTKLGEWGVNLSGGQKQRLTLARALAAKPEVLLLDDCLSAVDTVTEERILTHLNHALGEKSIVWVAHRDSTLRHCTEILEIKPCV